MECRVSTHFDPKYVDNSKRRLRLYQSTVTPKRTEHNLFVRIGRPKSEAEVTSNKRLIIRSSYCIVETNYMYRHSRAAA